MQISLDQARAFCAVVDQGGYTQAAEKLHKSHSSLIYLIKIMEEQCGFSLFDRKAYRNQLTPAGKRIFSKCREILNQVHELDQLCTELKGDWEPSVKIVFDGILPFYPFLEIYKKFKTEKIPTVVQTYTDYLHDVESSFYKLNADIMISVLPVESKDLEVIYLPPLKNVLVAHKDHPIHKTSKKWFVKDLHDFYFLTVRSSGQKLGLNTSDFEESASFYLSDFSFKKEAILKKTGFGWLPEHLIQSELKSKTLRPVYWERKSVHEIQPHILVNKKSFGGKAVSLILRQLVELS
jgi:DNA-binding transcriptional LysR family regulator